MTIISSLGRKWFAVINVRSVKEMSPDIATLTPVSTDLAVLALHNILYNTLLTPIDVC